MPNLFRVIAYGVSLAGLVASILLLSKMHPVSLSEAWTSPLLWAAVGTLVGTALWAFTFLILADTVDDVRTLAEEIDPQENSESGSEKYELPFQEASPNGSPEEYA